MNSHKRQKTEKFRPGFIVSVKVTNFTTYSNAEFQLSPTLNMIIGPNGTGKSTLVAAICLGLGGRIELIRRKTLKSMIKTGCSESTIEITLKNAEHATPEFLVIERTFTATELNWLVNNRVSDERTVRNVCRKLNIQLDNLCHFLPQERVAEFATLTPEKLLLQTERTLGTGHLITLHEDLIRLDSEREAVKAEVENNSSKLERLNVERQDLEAEAQKFEAYQKKTRDIELHKMLLPYAQLQDLKERQKELKRQRDEAKKKLQNFNLTTQPLENQLRQTDEQRRDILEQLDKLKNRHLLLTTQYKQQTAQVREATDKITELKASVESLANKSERRKQEAEKLKQERQELEAKLQSVPEVDEEALEDAKKNRDDAFRELNEQKSKRQQLEDTMEPKVSRIRNLQADLKRYEAKLTSTDKLLVLEARGRPYNELRENALKGHLLLRENPQLQLRYFEAPIVSCEVTHKAYAPFIEKVIDNNTLLAITVPDQESYDEVSRLVFSKYNVPMRLALDDPGRSPVPRERLHEYGFDGYLSDYINGPPEVLNMLKVISKLHMIPVRKDPMSDEQFQKLITPNASGQIPFMKFVVADDFVSVSRSRYGSRQFFYSTEKVRNASFFVTGGLSREARLDIKEKIASISHEYQQCRDEIKQLRQSADKERLSYESVSKRLSTARVKVEELQAVRSNRAKLVAYISAKADRIKKVEHDAQKDYTEKVRQTEQRINDMFYTRASKLAEAAQTLSQLTMLSIEMDCKNFKALQEKNRITTLKKLIHSLDDYKKTLVEEYEELKRKYDEIKKSDAARKVRQQSENYTENDRTVLSSLAESYLLENNLSEAFIQDRIHFLEDERSVMATADQSAIASLGQRLQEIKQLEQRLPHLEQEKNKFDQQIEDKRAKWEPELSSIVLKISSAFQGKFTAVASDGQVELVKAERFKDYKLQILVKFRENTDLKVLDNHSQSGGERAVSTIFFIMSLQGLTDAPFRVVDEINQGMDPKNEKMAHKYLVQTACENDSSQYFLVTPKLLTGLYYHPEMAVHCIYTGPFIESSDKSFLDFRQSTEVR
jgi:chromosome segregation ATPase